MKNKIHTKSTIHHSIIWQHRFFLPHLPWLAYNLTHLYRKLSASFDGFIMYLLRVPLAFFTLHWPSFTLTPLWPTGIERPERHIQSWQVSLWAWGGQCRPQELLGWVGGAIILALRSDSGLEFLRRNFSTFPDLITFESHESLRLASPVPWET